jgi:hypothetical protein
MYQNNYNKIIMLYTKKPNYTDLSFDQKKAIFIASINEYFEDPAKVREMQKIYTKYIQEEYANNDVSFIPRIAHNDKVKAHIIAACSHNDVESIAKRVDTFEKKLISINNHHYNFINDIQKYTYNRMVEGGALGIEMG